MNSQWLSGTLRHRRQGAVRHEFTYNTGMLALDVDEWHKVTDISPLFSLERFNWLSLKRKDYFQPETGGLSADVRNHVQKTTGWWPDGAVELITYPRYFGYVFNPVSFYFCYRAGDEAREGAIPKVILAQITNTPWKERHIYCLETTDSQPNSSGWASEKFGFRKRFHVSPFNGMEQYYQWTFSFHGPDLRIHMNVLEAGKKQFDATLVVHRCPLTRKHIHRNLRTLPVEAMKIISQIYWQAFRLKLKGASFHTHPDKLPKDAAAYRRGSDDSVLDVSDHQTANKKHGKVSSWRT